MRNSQNDNDKTDPTPKAREEDAALVYENTGTLRAEKSLVERKKTYLSTLNGSPCV